MAGAGHGRNDETIRCTARIIEATLETYNFKIVIHFITYSFKEQKG
jgi:hypothetical protein